MRRLEQQAKNRIEHKTQIRNVQVTHVEREAIGEIDSGWRGGAPAWKEWRIADTGDFWHQNLSMDDQCVQNIIWNQASRGWLLLANVDSHPDLHQACHFYYKLPCSRHKQAQHPTKGRKQLLVKKRIKQHHHDITGA